MPEPYDSAFDSIVRSRYLQLSPHGARDARRGDLSPAGLPAEAVSDTYSYQRSHADTFAAALAHAPPMSVSKKRVGILDLGAGAGTVAVALTEAWADDPPRRVRYVGVEPHPTMQSMGKDLLAAVAPKWMSGRLVGSVDKAELRGVDRYLVTLSYVIHQSALADEDLTAWARQCRSLTSLGPVELLMTTAISSNPSFRSRDRTDDWIAALQAAGVRGYGGRTPAIRVDQRYPTHGGGWTINSPWGNNVQVHYYKLAARDD